MRLPWVSRHAYEVLDSSRTLDRFGYQGQLDTARAEIARLTDIIVELRREGFQPPAPRAQMEPVEVTLDDAVLQAIAGRAAGLPEVERELVRYAHSMKHADPQTVADLIWRGSDYDGEDE